MLKRTLPALTLLSCSILLGGQAPVWSQAMTPSTQPASVASPVAALIASGLTKASAEDYRGAIADYSRALALDPYAVEAYIQRGNAYRRVNEMQKAIMDYNAALRLDSRQAVAYNGRGNARNALGELRLALEDYNQAIALDPKLDNAYYNRGNMRLVFGDRQGAIADLREAARLFQQGKRMAEYKAAVKRLQELNARP